MGMLLRSLLLLACLAVAGAQRQQGAKSHQQQLYSLLAEVQQAGSVENPPVAEPCAMGAGVVSVAFGCPAPLACTYPPCLPLPYPPAGAAPVAGAAPSDEMIEAAIRGGEKPNIDGKYQSRLRPGTGTGTPWFEGGWKFSLVVGETFA